MNETPLWDEVAGMVKDGMLNGVVKPLRTTVFSKDEVEPAFRFMAAGKHIGKVVIKVGFKSANTSFNLPVKCDIMPRIARYSTLNSQDDLSLFLSKMRCSYFRSLRIVQLLF